MILYDMIRYDTIRYDMRVCGLYKPVLCPPRARELGRGAPLRGRRPEGRDLPGYRRMYCQSTLISLSLSLYIYIYVYVYIHNTYNIM